MIVSVSVVYPHDPVADWDLGLPATVPHPEGVSWGILLAQEKDQNSKFEVWFLLNVYCFCSIVKLENCKLNTS